MAERPLVMSGPMVLATLHSDKTVTRRVATSDRPPCEPGDVLWVREAWRTLLDLDDTAPRLMDPRDTPVWYDADGDRDGWGIMPSGDPVRLGRGRPSIHMPRWASRLTLDVLDVRMEPLHCISTGDIWCEGVALEWRRDGMEHENVMRQFECVLRTNMEFIALWDRLNAHRPGASWADNPNVWRIEYAVRRRNQEGVPHD